MAARRAIDTVVDTYAPAGHEGTGGLLSELRPVLARVLFCLQQEAVVVVAGFRVAAGVVDVAAARQELHVGHVLDQVLDLRLRHQPVADFVDQCTRKGCPCFAALVSVFQVEDVFSKLVSERH